MLVSITLLRFFFNTFTYVYIHIHLLILHTVSIIYVIHNFCFVLSYTYNYLLDFFKYSVNALFIAILLFTSSSKRSLFFYLYQEVLQIIASFLGADFLYEPPLNPSFLKFRFEMFFFFFQ